MRILSHLMALVVCICLLTHMSCRYFRRTQKPRSLAKAIDHCQDARVMYEAIMAYPHENPYDEFAYREAERVYRLLKATGSAPPPPLGDVSAGTITEWRFFWATVAGLARGGAWAERMEPLWQNADETVCARSLGNLQDSKLLTGEFCWKMLGKMADSGNLDWTWRAFDECVVEEASRAGKKPDSEDYAAWEKGPRFDPRDDELARASFSYATPDEIRRAIMRERTALPEKASFLRTLQNLGGEWEPFAEELQTWVSDTAREVAIEQLMAAESAGAAEMPAALKAVGRGLDSLKEDVLLGLFAEGPQDDLPCRAIAAWIADYASLQPEHIDYDNSLRLAPSHRMLSAIAPWVEQFPELEKTRRYLRSVVANSGTAGRGRRFP